MLEAIVQCERIAGGRLDWRQCRAAGSVITVGGSPTSSRSGAIIPEWRIHRDVEAILREILEHNAERWLAMA